jgi:hypothetical protein
VDVTQLGSRASFEQRRIMQRIVYCRFMVSSAIESGAIRVFLTLATIIRELIG